MTWTLASRYQLTNQITGGENRPGPDHGSVWRALDRGTGRPVAVKLLHPRLVDTRVAERLRRARSTLTGIWHPHLACLLDVVVDEGRVALVAELVPGEDLATMRARGRRLPPGRAVRVAADVAEALAAGHRLGVAHGDVRPSKVLIPADGGPVRLTDFAVAPLVWAGRPRPAPTEYGAPEVIEGAPAGPASDVYALGVLLHELLAGPRQGIDDRLHALVDQCRHADPAARPSAVALAEQLRGLAPAPESGAMAPRAGRHQPDRRRPTRLGLLLGGTAAAVAVVVAIAGTALGPGPGAPGQPGPIDATTVAATEQPPALPAAAAEPTSEGGTAFVRYWFATVGYAAETGDTAALSAATNPSCQDCVTAMATIEAAYAAGGSMRGGGYVVRTVSTASLWSAGQPVYDATVDRAPRTTVDHAGAAHDALPALSFVNCVLVLEWTGDQWRVLEVTTRGCVA